MLDCGTHNTPYRSLEESNREDRRVHEGDAVHHGGKTLRPRHAAGAAQRGRDHQPLRRVHHRGGAAPAGEARRRGRSSSAWGRPPRPTRIRKALAMGADRGVLVSDDALAGSDAIGTARVLAAALQEDRLRPGALRQRRRRLLWRRRPQRRRRIPGHAAALLRQQAGYRRREPRRFSGRPSSATTRSRRRRPRSSASSSRSTSRATPR